MRQIVLNDCANYSDRRWHRCRGTELKIDGGDVGHFCHNYLWLEVVGYVSRMDANEMVQDDPMFIYSIHSLYYGVQTSNSNGQRMP